jgi:hypothetical protein
VYTETWQVHKNSNKKSPCGNFSGTLLSFEKSGRNVAGSGIFKKKKLKALKTGSGNLGSKGKSVPGSVAGSGNIRKNQEDLSPTNMSMDSAANGGSVLVPENRGGLAWGVLSRDGHRDLKSDLPRGLVSPIGVAPGHRGGRDGSLKIEPARKAQFRFHPLFRNSNQQINIAIESIPADKCST